MSTTGDAWDELEDLDIDKTSPQSKSPQVERMPERVATKLFVVNDQSLHMRVEEPVPLHGIGFTFTGEGGVLRIKPSGIACSRDFPCTHCVRSNKTTCSAFTTPIKVPVIEVDTESTTRWPGRGYPMTKKDSLSRTKALLAGRPHPHAVANKARVQRLATLRPQSPNPDMTEWKHGVAQRRAYMQRKADLMARQLAGVNGAAIGPLSSGCALGIHTQMIGVQLSA
jgi:hypothetical protein